MGDPRKLKRKFETPKKIWDSDRIEKEKGLLLEFGLKNMRELWVTQKELKKIRRQARLLLAQGERGVQKGKELLSKVVRLGLAKEGATLESLLSLNIQDILDRRLQTRVFKKGLARTMKQSRQLIIHGFIAIKDRKITAPSYMVPVNEESLLTYYKAIDLEPKPPTTQ
ncbi:30S ribosomal protein S4 [Candidatus Micrarchaeota archaeon]|nr:30S ribosomal protein S4 [Candidatus Micrarchaeota archaeon]